MRQARLRGPWNVRDRLSRVRLEGRPRITVMLSNVGNQFLDLMGRTGYLRGVHMISRLSILVLLREDLRFQWFLRRTSRIVISRWDLVHRRSLLHNLLVQIIKSLVAIRWSMLKIYQPRMLQINQMVKVIRNILVRYFLAWFSLLSIIMIIIIHNLLFRHRRNYYIRIFMFGNNWSFVRWSSSRVVKLAIEPVWRDVFATAWYEIKSRWLLVMRNENWLVHVGFEWFRFVEPVGCEWSGELLLDDLLGGFVGVEMLFGVGL